jgi:hypothetical protein
MSTPIPSLPSQDLPRLSSEGTFVTEIIKHTESMTLRTGQEAEEGHARADETHAELDQEGVSDEENDGMSPSKVG